MLIKSNCILIIIILLILPNISNTYYINNFYFPKEYLTNFEKEFYYDVIDGGFEKFDCFEAFLIVSGVVSFDEFYFYDKRYKEVCSSLEKYFLLKNNIAPGKRILKWLHKNLFRNYKKDTIGIHDLFNAGLFDCLSSSLIFYMLCNRFKIKVRFVEVPEHIFCQVYDNVNNKWIDVETTSPYGYDFDKFDNRVQKNNTIKLHYKNKKIINFNKALSKMFLERNSLINKDDKLINKKINAQKLYNYKKVFIIDRRSSTLRNNLISALSNLSNCSLKNNDFNKAIIYIEEGLNNFGDEVIFKNLHVNYFLYKSRFFNNKKQYIKAKTIIENGLENYPNSQKIKNIFCEVINILGNKYFKKKNYNKAIEYYEYGLDKYGDNKVLKNNVRSCFYNKALGIYNSNQLEESLRICNYALNKFPHDYKIQNLYKEILYNISIRFYNQDKLSYAKKYCQIGKSKYPESNKWDILEEDINRAYKIFYYNNAIDDYRKGAYDSAYQKCIKGLQIQTKSNDLDHDLRDLQKKCEFWL